MRPRLLITAVLVVALAGACSSSSKNNASPASSTTVPPHRLDSTLRLDQVQVLASHNSYHALPYPEVLADLYKQNAAVAQSLDYGHAPLPEQFELGVRQIELDVWDDTQGGTYANPAYPIRVGAHVVDDPAMHKPGFKVIHQAGVDTNSTCLTFVACLGLVKAWSDAHPGHVAMMVQIEMKDDAPTEPMFQRLEHEILSVFPRDDIVTPDDVRGSAPTLGAAVSEHGWPTLGATRGKVYFALDNEGFRANYSAGHPSLKGRLIFTPSAPGQPDAAFAKLNDPIKDAAKIKAALAAHMIVRTRADADTVQARTNDTTSREAALNEGAQIVSTDYEKPDPRLKNGYTVKIPGGMPARCDPVTAPPDCQPIDVENPAFLRTR